MSVIISGSEYHLRFMRVKFPTSYQNSSVMCACNEILKIGHVSHHFRPTTPECGSP